MFTVKVDVADAPSLSVSVAVNSCGPSGRMPILKTPAPAGTVTGWNCGSVGSLEEMASVSASASRLPGSNAVNAIPAATPVSTVTSAVWISGATLTTVSSTVVVSEFPVASVTVSVTVYVPLSTYLWSGNWSVLVPPSPKSHCHDTMSPFGSLLASTKCTSWPSFA